MDHDMPVLTLTGKHTCHKPSGMRKVVHYTYKSGRWRVKKCYNQILLCVFENENE